MSTDVKALTNSEYTLAPNPNKVYTAKEGKYSYLYGYQDQVIALNTTTMQTINYPFSTGLLGDWVLEVYGTSGITYNVGEMCGAQMLNTVKWIGGTKAFFSYIGQALGDYILVMNSSTDQKRILTRNLVDAGYGNIGTNSVFIPLLGPGQNCVSGSHSTPIDVGAIEGGLTISIKFNPGNIVSVTNAYSYAFTRMHFKSYQVDSSTLPLYRTIQMCDLDSFAFGYKTVSLTQGTAASITIDQPIQIGKEYIALYLYITTSTNFSTNFKTFQGEEITTGVLKINNDIQQEWYSTAEAQKLMVERIGSSMIKTDFANGKSYQYLIPFKTGLLTEESWQNSGSAGKVLFPSVFNLSITTSYAGTNTFIVNTTLISKAQFRINSNRIVEFNNSGF